MPFTTSFFRNLFSSPAEIDFPLPVDIPNQNLVKPSFKEIITVISLDYDGCFAHKVEVNKPEDIISQNKSLLEYIKQISMGSSKIILYSGSSRQSCYLEKKSVDLNKNGLSHEMMRALAPRIKEITGIECEFRPLSSADLCNGLAIGGAFNVQNQNSDEYHTIYDKSKSSLIYMQAHDAAHSNPNAYTQFHFLDDEPGILAELNAFFMDEDDKKQLPLGLRLYLREYSGQEVKIHKQQEQKGEVEKSQAPFIEGKGLIDSEYRKTLLESYKQNVVFYTANCTQEELNYLQDLTKKDVKKWVNEKTEECWNKARFNLLLLEKFKIVFPQPASVIAEKTVTPFAGIMQGQSKQGAEKSKSDGYTLS